MMGDLLNNDMLLIIGEFGGIDVRRALGFLPRRLEVSPEFCERWETRPQSWTCPWGDKVELQVFCPVGSYGFVYDELSNTRYFCHYPNSRIASRPNVSYYF